jgi:D-glycero-alpha-D-manno-heptose-7-phosphate kinase
MILSHAPFRISLGGGGTDLSSYYSRYGGFVISAAIDKYVNIYVNRPAADNFIRLKYSRYEQVERVEDIQHDLVRPTLKELGLGPSIEISSMADIPAGTGLGSSSTYLVAMLTALYELKREKISQKALAEKACKIEIELAHHPVGKQDQYVATFGGIICMEIDLDGNVCISPLNISTSTEDDIRNNVLLFYTGINRSADDILRSQVEDTKQNKQDVIESLHLTKELGYRVKECMESGNIDNFGLILHEHWENKKRRNTKISNPQIDHWYQFAKENGALGGKVMGAGGGGFFMFYCQNGRKPKFRKALMNSGLRELRYDFDHEGAKVLINI